MKQKILFLTATLIALFYANNVKAQYAIDINYGLSGVSEPRSNEIKHFGAGISYDFDEVYGVKFDVGSDKFRVDNAKFGATGINVTRISLQGTMNISTAITRLNSARTVNLIAHAGGGISTIKPFNTKGSNDNVMNVVVGLTPRFKLTRDLFFALDTSLVFNISQHYNFDGTPAYSTVPNSFTGITYNVTGGLVYYIRAY